MSRKNATKGCYFLLQYYHFLFIIIIKEFKIHKYFLRENSYQIIWGPTASLLRFVYKTKLLLEYFRLFIEITQICKNANSRTIMRGKIEKKKGIENASKQQQTIYI